MTAPLVGRVPAHLIARLRNGGCVCSFVDGRMTEWTGCPMHDPERAVEPESDQSNPTPADGAENATQRPLRASDFYPACSCSWSPPAVSPDCRVHGSGGWRYWLEPDEPIIPLPSETLLRDRSHDLARQAATQGYAMHDRTETMQQPATDSGKGSLIAVLRLARARVSAALRAITDRIA